MVYLTSEVRGKRERYIEWVIIAISFMINVLIVCVLWQPRYAGAEIQEAIRSGRVAVHRFLLRSSA